MWGMRIYKQRKGVVEICGAESIAIGTWGPGFSWLRGRNEGSDRRSSKQPKDGRDPFVHARVSFKTSLSVPITNFLRQDVFQWLIPSLNKISYLSSFNLCNNRYSLVYAITTAAPMF